ncbi:MAG: cytochrome c biogenesis protein CcsA [Candidatus Omnitrophica bacterium]|nr:cytochrome c biogenesis protein CcsA [Candidatus Omnitrophota bacterium]
MNLSFLFLSLSAVFYGAAFLMHLFSFFGLWEGGRKLAFLFLRLGFFVGTFYFAAEAVDHSFFLPVSGTSQAMAFLAWAIAFVYLVLLVRVQSESFGLILTPILFFFVLMACLSFRSGAKPLPFPVTAYFVVHILSAFFAYASFTLSFAAGILYLIQNHELKVKRTGRFHHQLPSLEELEKLIYQPIVWGLPLLVFAMGIGFLWAKSAFGVYWIYDPKTLAVIVTALLYLAILYLHYISAMRGKRVVVFSLVAFALVLFSFVGTRFIQGSHNFF